MPDFHLAQLNIARMKAALDSPQMSGFTDNLEHVNRLAEQSPGYIWRLQTDDGDATALRPFGHDVLVNLSVWQDLASLRAFVFESAHQSFLRRRADWFNRLDEASTVLWWIPVGSEPSLPTAWQKLEHLRAHGPYVEAFSFRQPFDPPS